MKKSEYTVAVIGATGLVGREIVAALEERVFPLGRLHAFATHASIGQEIGSGAAATRVAALDAQTRFDDVDIVFFAANERVSAEWVERVTAAGAVAIDLSGLFVDDPEVPVIVPEVNAPDSALYGLRRLVVSPDTATIAAAVVLEPLRALSPVRRVVLTTFEPVSGSGRAGIAELERQTLDLMSGRDTDVELYPHRIAFNALPHIGEFLAGGVSHGEHQTQAALRRVLNDAALALSVTRVRAPLFYGTGVSLNVELAGRIGADAVREHLRKAPGILVADDPSDQVYPTPAEAVSSDATCVGRVRENESLPVLDLWLTIDNTRKGAAVNAVQIAELLVRDHL